MVLKVGFLIVFLLLFQTLEAKKKKQEPGITTQISTYVSSVGDFFKDAWEGFLELLPSTTNEKPTKKNKTTKGDQNLGDKIIQGNTNMKGDKPIVNENKKKDKKAKKKKVQKNSWGFSSVMESAKKNFNSLYNSVSESMQMFQTRRLERSLDGEDEDNLPSFEELFDSLVKDVIKEFTKEFEVKKLEKT